MMMNVLKCVGFLLGTSLSYAQNIYIETSLSSASFEEFRNDDNVNTLNNTYSKPVELGIGVGTVFNITTDERLKWDLGIAFNTYKINTSFNSSNSSTPTQYDLNYMSLKTGPYFSVLNSSRIKLQLHAHSSIDYLTFGSNQYSDVYVDLTKGGSFSKLVSSYHYGVAIEIALTDSNAMYISYDYKNSLTNTIEADQPYRLQVTSVLVGLRFKLAKLQNN